MPAPSIDLFDLLVVALTDLNPPTLLDHNTFVDVFKHFKTSDEAKMVNLMK